MGKVKKHHHAVKLLNILDKKLATKLSAAGVDKVGQVRKLTDEELLGLPGIGAKSVEAIRAEIPA
jgi:DNA-directed RNA polymerase alpha subunit